MAGDGVILGAAEAIGGKSLNEKFWTTALWLGVGVAVYLTFQNTIGSLLNPLLSPLKLSATPS